MKEITITALKHVLGGICSCYCKDKSGYQVLVGNVSNIVKCYSACRKKDLPIDTCDHFSMLQ